MAWEAAERSRAAAERVRMSGKLHFLERTMTKIEWTGETSNPVTGCTKVSAGCTHCCAERMPKRLRNTDQANAAEEEARQAWAEEKAR